MCRPGLRSFIVGILLSAVIAPAARADGPPFELPVKHDHVFGSSKGTLVVSTDLIEYRTTDKGDARRWRYEDVKQVQVLSPTQIAVLTYEDGGRLTLGADRTYNFRIVGSAVSTDLVTFLLARVERPVVTAVMPQYDGTPLFRVPVKHQRQGRGTQGTLLLYDGQLLYLTEQEKDSRYWRFGDIESIQRLDRFRLQITTYEGGSGDSRPFVFELKADLPDGFYDALWARVNPAGLELSTAPRALTGGDTR